MTLIGLHTSAFMAVSSPGVHQGNDDIRHQDDGPQIEEAGCDRGLGKQHLLEGGNCEATCGQYSWTWAHATPGYVQISHRSEHERTRKNAHHVSWFPTYCGCRRPAVAHAR
jgi:hypothetical protein